MTSQINYTGIDNAYPVAGQDNDSQGFRDNFTVIKNNFNYSKSEIEDLQNKALLKAPLTGSGTTVSNDLSSVKLYGAETSGFTETVTSITYSTTVTANIAAAPLQTFTLTASADVAFGFTWAAQPLYSKVRLLIDPNGYTGNITFTGTAVNSQAPGFTNNILTLNKTVRFLEISTYSAGTTIYIRDLLNSVPNTTNLIRANLSVSGLVTVSNTTSTLLLDTTAGAQRTGSTSLANITLPSSDQLSNGQVLKIISNCAIDSVNTIAGSGTTILSPLWATGGIVVKGNAYSWTYSTTTSCWHRS